ncbi:MAG: response regulator [Alphaproteobacteria bacterium]|nr:response regulator [Alphaproteobacteria bacterium]MDE2629564.1 response regulator [Alphaproteobacteria bacterium]
MSGATFDHLKALIVEDNVHMRTLLRSLLAALGINHVYEAADGADALATLRDKAPDMILTDLSMKPVDGIAFTRSVRLSHDSPNPYVPIIMITGHTERHKVEAARDAGVTEFLAKPITAQGLFLRIAEIVERPRAYVRCASYFGPDRRRRADDNYAGPWRRHEDLAKDLELK